MIGNHLEGTFAEKLKSSICTVYAYLLGRKGALVCILFVCFVFYTCFKFTLVLQVETVCLCISLTAMIHPFSIFISTPAKEILFGLFLEVVCMTAPKMWWAAIGIVNFFLGFILLMLKGLWDYHLSWRLLTDLVLPCGKSYFPCSASGYKVPFLQGLSWTPCVDDHLISADSDNFIKIIVL